jgi:hypothetical protein
MFETPEERAEQLLKIRKETLELLQIEEKDAYDVFYHANTSRLRKEAFTKLKKLKQFIVVEVAVESFKTQDLIKISKLHSSLYFIDNKNSIIYTMDEDFANWVRLSTGHINSIRLS